MTEIERDVVIERIPHDWEAAYSAGTPAAEEMPIFTEEELRIGLGDEYCDRVRKLFADALNSGK